MFLLTSSTDEDIIDVDNDSWQVQDMSRFPVEDFRPGTDSKRKLFETVSPKWCDECSQFLRFLMQWDLIKSAVAVKFAEHFGTRELCKKLISRGKGEVLTSNAFDRGQYVSVLPPLSVSLAAAVDEELQ